MVGNIVMVSKNQVLPQGSWEGKGSKLGGDLISWNSAPSSVKGRPVGLSSTITKDAKTKGERLSPLDTPSERQNKTKELLNGNGAITPVTEKEKIDAIERAKKSGGGC